MGVKAGGWVLVGVAALLALLSLDPARLGWSTLDGVAQLIGVRSWLAIGFGVLGLVLLVVLVSGRRRGAERSPHLAALALVALVACGVHGGVLLARGLTAGQAPTAAAEQTGDVTVLSANLFRGEADLDAVVGLIESTGADVVTLAESGTGVPERLVQRLAESGADFQLFLGEQEGAGARGSALLVSASLGEYVEVPSDIPGVVGAEPADGHGLPLAAVHPVSMPESLLTPTAADHMATWRRDVQAVRTLATQMPGGVIAGDMNATLDHAPLRDVPGYVDAGAAAGIGGYGTFPSWLPGWAGVQIDRVLVAPDVAQVGSAAVVDVAGSDHRAVVVRLVTS